VTGNPVPRNNITLGNSPSKVTKCALTVFSGVTTFPAHARKADASCFLGMEQLAFSGLAPILYPLWGRLHRFSEWVFLWPETKKASEVDASEAHDSRASSPRYKCLIGL
jgi:hypothetical protein